jgi:molecular chaperone GrpE
MLLRQVFYKGENKVTKEDKSKKDEPGGVMPPERNTAGMTPAAQPDAENASPQVDPGEAEIIEVLEAEDMLNLKAELEQWKDKANEYLDGWQRSRAEFANYKKRVEREQAQAYQNAAGSIFKRFLDVLDDLDRALKNLPRSGEGSEWSAGVELAYRKFISILEAEGVKVIEAEGQQFDPNLHEAISHEEVDGIPSDQIIEVVKNGYLLGDWVLRPAVVRVAK